MSLTDAQVDAVLASRANSCAEDGEDSRPLWYRMDELAGLWGDEFAAMHALAQEIKDRGQRIADLEAALKDAVDLFSWLNGVTVERFGEFPLRQSGDGTYYWRKYMRHHAKGIVSAAAKEARNG